ncbi:hypothetical protein F5J12DRAFT_740479 [Pisolithus orientalis]|uniref:uncharacterized protein n=1 Tax=Pisolithus orientalis TaxID=936130 RepID=UPI002224B07A|nr:uncharacterized protein F5J12DRAFT_740479 [Pisolithus orientalis]KAI6010718.1 hypothetical protein F5J12DRAFT_740479 [Pisolithus orientalis]
MAANALWAHILQKDSIIQDSTPPIIPPLAPKDATGTSMRMLIYDTQSTLEKFSGRLDTLMTRVDDCRSQVINANKLLDHEHDKVVTEMVDISSRSQNELKSHMGTPAQAHALELTHASQVSTENSIRALEKRIDALQTLVQSHTSAFASIQDQQNAIQAHQSTLLDTVLPLLQLLQNLPSQFDQLKSSLADAVSSAEANLGTSIGTIKNAIPRLALDHAQPKPPVGPELTSKQLNSTPRKRTNAFHEMEGRSKATGNATCSTHSPKRTRLSPAPKRAFRTPRLPVTTSNENVSLAPRRFTSISSEDASRMRSRNSMPKLLMSKPDNEKAESERSTVLERNAPKKFPSVISISSSPLSDAAAPMPPCPSATLDAGSSPAINSTEPQARKDFRILPRVILSHNSVRPPNHPLDLTLPPPSGQHVVSSTRSPPKSMSLRDRRTQMTLLGRARTKRFIPIVASSDEES